MLQVENADTFHAAQLTGWPAALLILVGMILLLLPYWRIWSRTGHSGLWSLLLLVPFVNLISLWVLAFKKWPAVEAGRTGLR